MSVQSTNLEDFLHLVISPLFELLVKISALHSIHKAIQQL